MGLITRKELNKYMNNNINKLYNAYPIFAQIDKKNLLTGEIYNR